MSLGRLYEQSQHPQEEVLEEEEVLQHLKQALREPLRQIDDMLERRKLILKSAWAADMFFFSRAA